MKRKALVFLTVCGLLLAMLPMGISAEPNLTEGRDEIPYGAAVTAGNYAPGTAAVMDEAEAAAASVPAGYSGYVISLTNHAEIGMKLDLSDRDLYVADLEAITFRVWVPATVAEVRLFFNGSWVMQQTPSAYNTWMDVTVKADGTGFNTGKNFNNLADADGRITLLNLCFRDKSAPTTTVYIDSVTFTMREADTVPPVITYNGSTTVETTAGHEFSVDATAYDAYSEQNVPIEYIWSDGALDADGRTVMGEHTCTLRATDRAGNTSEIVLTVTVGSADTEKPVIDWTADTVHVLTGAYVALDISASDNLDGEIEPELIWSDGALAEDGRSLLAGTHTLRVVATDKSGNADEMTVTVVVSDALPAEGTIICDTE